MIKTAVIIERADISLGGAERSIFELTSQLAQLGVDVTLLAATGQAKTKNVLVLCNDAESKRISLADFEVALKKHFEQNQYDIIHSTLPFDFADIYQPRGGSYLEAIIRNAESYRNKAISSYKKLTHFVNVRRAALLSAEKKLCQKQHTIVAALSEYVSDQFKRHYNLPDDKIEVIGNAIKTNKTVNTDHADQLRGQILKHIGITEADEPALFLFAANNFRLKGLSRAIKAVGQISKQEKARPVYLVVAGSGSSHKYRRLAAMHRVSKKIVFLGPLRNIQDALSICDAAILPSYYDPCSRFILEGLAQGKPAITTRFNGASERYVHKRHGWILDTPDDVEQMAEAMIHYADSANVAAAKAAIEEDNLKDELSITKHAKAVIALYERILSKKS